MELRDKNLYFIGGVVRDEILNIPSFDTDYCYEGNAIDFAKNFNVIKTNPDFGTVRIKTESGEIERTGNHGFSGFVGYLQIETAFI